MAELEEKTYIFFFQNLMLEKWRIFIKIENLEDKLFSLILDFNHFFLRDEFFKRFFSKENFLNFYEIYWKIMNGKKFYCGMNFLNFANTLESGFKRRLQENYLAIYCLSKERCSWNNVFSSITVWRQNPILNSTCIHWLFTVKKQ